MLTIKESIKASPIYSKFQIYMIILYEDYTWHSYEKLTALDEEKISQKVMEIENNLKEFEEVSFYSTFGITEVLEKCENLKKIKFFLYDCKWEEYLTINEQYGEQFALEFHIQRLIEVDSKNYLNTDTENLMVTYQVTLGKNIKLMYLGDSIKLEIILASLKSGTYAIDAIEKLLQNNLLTSNDMKLITVLYIKKSEIEYKVQEQLLMLCKLDFIIVENTEFNYWKCSQCDSLSGIFITEISALSLDELPEMKNIKELSLNNCKLKKVDDLNSKFPNLRELDLSNNEISGLIINLPPKLNKINLSNNLIEKIIFNVENASKQQIHLNNNNILEIENIGSLHKDTDLFLDYNPIINNVEFLKSIKGKLNVSILPRIVFQNKSDVIGNFGIIENDILNEKFDSKEYPTTEILRLIKYSEAMNCNYSVVPLGKSLDNNMSFMINGKWGSGKSFYFQKKLKASLEAEGFKVFEYVPTLNNKEDSFKTILTMMNGSSESYTQHFFIELFKRRYLVSMLLVTYLVLNICIDYYNFLNSNPFIIRLITNSNFNLFSSILNSLPTSLFLAVISIPFGLLFQNQEELNQEETLMNRAKENYIVLIDDLERVRIDKQIEIINSVQTLKNHVHVIVLIDEIEFKKIILSYYGYEFNYIGFKSKVFDYEYKYTGIPLVKYYEDNIVVKNEQVDFIIKGILQNSLLVRNLSVRDFKKYLNTVFHKITQCSLNQFQGLIRVMFNEACVNIDTTNQVQMFTTICLVLKISGDKNNQYIDSKVIELLNFDMYLVNYNSFSEEFRKAQDSKFIKSGKLDSIQLEYSDIILKKITLESIDKFIQHVTEWGIIDELYNILGVISSNQLTEKIFRIINEEE